MTPLPDQDQASRGAESTGREVRGMTTATAPGRTAETNEMWRSLADVIGHTLVEAGPGMAIGCGVFELVADRLMAGPLAQLQADLIAARNLAEQWKATAEAEAEIGNERVAEAAHLRARLQEAEQAAEAMRGRCMEVIQAVYDGWDRNNPEEKWPRVALSQAMVQIRQIPPQIKEAGDGR